MSNYKRLTGTAELNLLKLRDIDGTLGLPQDALDNLANLAKETVVKVNFISSINIDLANCFL